MAVRGQNLSTNIAAGSAVFGQASTAGNVSNRVSAALTAGNAVGALSSAMRSINLPIGGEAVSDVISAVAAFAGDQAGSDWRVRLSLPTWSSFRSSPVLRPLVEAGGLIFPYTPEITIKTGATYSKESPVHSNFQFNAYKNSEPGTIEISAPMNVEDPVQALYWIASVHYLRSLAKMFSGNDLKAGNPPPIVYLNGYGNFVFRNVPVAITNFQCRLGSDCDYIATDVVGSAAGKLAGFADAVGGLSDVLGGSIPGIAGAANSISSIAGGVGQIAGVLGTFGIGGTTSGGKARVPTKSSFSITLQPMYSRNSTRKFSLDRFVTGGYLNQPFGYI
jgi:hypothetical protein